MGVGEFFFILIFLRGKVLVPLSRGLRGENFFFSFFFFLVIRVLVDNYIGTEEDA